MTTEEKKIILVTGSNGFVGKFMVRALFEAGYKVKGLVLPGTNLDALNGLSMDIAYGDIRDTQMVENAVKGTQAVIHLAAAVGGDAAGPGGGAADGGRRAGIRCAPGAGGDRADGHEGGPCRAHHPTAGPDPRA